MAYKVQAKRIDGGYALSYGRGSKKRTAVATARPGGKFAVVVPGRPPLIGKLRDVKERWGQMAAAEYEQSGQAPIGPATPALEPISFPESTRPEVIQDWINRGTTRTQQIERWVMAYNAESVAVHFGAERHSYTLPVGPPVFPPLADCFDPDRDQYIWPTRYPDSFNKAPWNN